MNLIAKNTISLLPAELQKFVSLRQEPTIRNIQSVNQVKKACVDILTEASFDMGSPMADTPKVLQFQTEALFKELSGKLKDLTLSEVREAFKMGIRGEFGQYFGLCPKTYNQFLKSYYDMEDRHNAITAYLQKANQDTQRELTEEEKLKIAKQGALNRFKEYRETGDLGSMTFVIYDIINDLIGTDIPHTKKGTVKTLISDPVERKMIVEDSRNEYRELAEKHIKQANHRGEDIRNIPAILEKSNLCFEYILKRRFLKAYFDQLIKEKKELEL